VTDDARLAVAVRLGAQVRGGAGQVAEEPVLRHATGRPYHRGRVVGAGPRRVPPVEVRADRGVPVGREPPHHLLGGLVVPGHVVDDHHATDRCVGDRAGRVGLDLIALVALDHDCLGAHRVAHRNPSHGVLPGPNGERDRASR